MRIFIEAVVKEGSHSAVLSYIVQIVDLHHFIEQRDCGSESVTKVIVLLYAFLNNAHICVYVALGKLLYLNVPVVFLVIYVGAVTSPAFSHIQHFIDQFKKIGKIVGIGRIRGASDRARYHNLSVLKSYILSEDLAAFKHGIVVFRIRREIPLSREDQQQLVTSEPSCQAHFRGIKSQRLSHLHENNISGAVSESVIDIFKVVKVYYRKRKRSSCRNERMNKLQGVIP